MKKVVLRVNGITNTNGQNRIEKELKKNPKIKSITMDIKNNRLIVMGTKDLSIDEIEKNMDELGYESLGVDLIRTTQKPSFLPFIILGIPLVIMLYFSFAKGFHLPLENLFSQKLERILLCSLVSVFIIYGFDILLEGIEKGIKGQNSLYALALTSIVGSLSYGLYQLFVHPKDIKYLYLEIGLFLIYFIKISQYIDRKNKRTVEEEISQLSKTKLDKVNRKTEDAYEEINVEEVRIGDTLLCLPGDKVLLDGVIKNGSTHFDEALITGESIPAIKQGNSKIISGSINYENEIEYATSVILKDATISNIKKMVAEEKSIPKKVRPKINRFCNGWIPLAWVISLSMGAFHYLNTGEINSSIVRVVLFLIISCPIGFILATPLSFHQTNKIANKKKIFTKKMETLEQVRKINTIVLDKTGTITNGYLSIAKVNNHSDLEDKKLLELLGSIEKHSTTALARGITKYLRNERVSISYDLLTEDLPGYGVKAKDEENTYYACNRELLKKLDIVNPYQEEERKLQQEGNTVIYLVKNTKVIATIGLKDILKKDMKKVINSLQEKNIDVILLTGDNEVISDKIARELELKNVYSGMNPIQKRDFIKTLIEKKKKVMMIGDGINDAPAMAVATIGIAIKNASDVPTSAADIILNSSNLFKILDLFTISKTLHRFIKRNILISLLIYLVEAIIALGIVPKIKMTPIILIIGLLLNLLLILFNTSRIKNK